MKNHDLIDRFFENSLSPKDQKLFNNLLQNDSDFKKEFVFQKDLKQVIALRQREELKSSLSQLEEKVQKNSRFMIMPKKWMVAASFLLIVSVGILGVKSVYYPSNEAIYTEYFQADRNTVQPVVRGESIETIEYRAFVAYEAKDYYKAINLFNSVKSPGETYITYYKALCYLSLDKKDEAITLFNQVATNTAVDDDYSEFKEKAHWYLALAYIKKNDQQKALTHLKHITNSVDATFKKQEAQEILKYIE